MRILVAEDEPATAGEIEGRLAEFGHTVVGVATTAEETLALAAARRPDLVLLDIQLGGAVDGVSVGHRLRADHQVPVVYLTAQVDAATVQRATASRPFGYVLKPFDERTLQMALEVAAQMHMADQALRQANAQLAASVAALEQRTHEVTTLSALGGALLRCAELAESYIVIAEAARALFPTSSGVLLIQRSGAPTVEPVAVWGDAPPAAQPLSPSACWALRHRRIHRRGEGSPVCACDGFPTGDAGLICVPLATREEALGALLIRVAGGDPDNVESQHRLALALAEHAALGLANLQLRGALHEQAIRDPLTGLYNRRYLDDLLIREQARAVRHRYPIGLILIDIDHFKRINDTYGHDAGDTVLRAVSQLLLSSVRAEDVVCRYGGEEFVLVLPSASPAVTIARAESLRQAIARLEIAYDGRPLPSVTISAGVSDITSADASVADSLRRADVALYAAKGAGRNRVVPSEGSGLPLTRV